MMRPSSIKRTGCLMKHLVERNEKEQQQKSFTSMGYCMLYLAVAGLFLLYDNETGMSIISCDCII
jgi:site-specific recombinase